MDPSGVRFRTHTNSWGFTRKKVWNVALVPPCRDPTGPLRGPSGPLPYDLSSLPIAAHSAPAPQPLTANPHVFSKSAKKCAEK